MRSSSLTFVVVALSGLAIPNCRQQPTTDSAIAGVTAVNTSATRTAVGPVPGPEVASTPVVNPYANQESAMVEGRQLFVRFNCSGCHGGRAGGGMGPSLRDVDWLYGNSEGQLFSSISQGRAHGMPSWGTKLTEEQVWKLVTYVDSLRTPAEPHPPEG